VLGEVASGLVGERVSVRRVHRPLSVLVVSAAVGLFACRRDETQLLVIVDSDIPADRMDAVWVSVRSDLAHDELGPVSLIGGARTLPISFGIVPKEPRFDREITIRARGLLRGVSMVEVERSVPGFEQGKKIEVRLFLSIERGDAGVDLDASNGIDGKTPFDGGPLDATAEAGPTDVISPDVISPDVISPDAVAPDANPDAGEIDAGTLFDPALCGAGYALAANGGYYRLSSVAASWATAHQDCTDDGAGTHLAVLGTPEESTLASSLVPLGTSIWIGLQDLDENGVWRWVTGEIPAYAGWEGDEPDGPLCADVQRSRWDADDCGTAYLYLCECDGRGVVEP
jgi:hypothetical protein